MKRAFRISFIIILLSTVCTLNAQTYRLEIGYNNPQRFGPTVSSTNFNGIKIGGTVEFQLKNNFSLLTGALYNLVYSNKLQMYPNADSVTYMSVGHSIDIPVRLHYTYPFSKDFKVFGYAGPNLNIGLSQFQGTVSTLGTAESTYTGIVSNTKDLYQASILNRLNLQVGVGGGVQWKKYQLKAGYDFGINTLNVSGSNKLYQSGWYVSLAYDF